ncbi:Transposase [Cordylochernes scorpioides]|uniref:Transposase n=1 Tax=Cordylochernes scorpioides TaxID=51811 RepID=A0ABY6KDA2_9ARAC|nr:Transposase [Cordylochernes scorpioides]
MTEDSNMQRMTEAGDEYFADALTNMQPHCEDLVSRLTDAIRGIAVPRVEEALISPFDGSYAASNFIQQLERTSEGPQDDATLQTRLRTLLKGEYYRQKITMGLQLGLTNPIIVEALTEGLQASDQRLMRAIAPKTLTEWNPLNNLLKKDTPWHWDAECQHSFDTLKECLTTKPGIAGILKQQHPDGTLHPVQYYSRALRPHEKNYTITELECLAVIDSVEKFRIYLAGVRTISRRLVANGLHSCRPLRRLPLTPPNRRQRLEWCRARSTWMTEWHRVVFSDESRFCLSSDSRRVRVWRRREERSNPAAIVERPTVRQRGIMVWGAIAYDSRSPLLRIQGTMTAQRYVDDVLRPVTIPYLQGVPNALYQQDNARPHTARISQQALQDVQMLPWPPYSPDLSPIEHVWDIIGRCLHALPQPRSEDELWQMVEREWRAIPQDAISTLIDSLPRRVAACIAVRGGPTCY